MKKVFKTSSITIMVLYLLIPIFVTFLFSIATKWTFSILPEGLTFNWYSQLFQDPVFLMAVGRTFGLAILSVVLSLIIIVPSIFAIFLFFPKLQRWIDLFIIATYSVPGVISAMSLLTAYDSINIPSILLVLGSYIVGSLPIMYIGVSNALRSINANTLMEASEILGASKLTAFQRVILPNIKGAVISTALFRFSGLFGEFATINLLVGGRFETIQIYLRKNINMNGHFSSAVVITYFLIVTIVTVIALVILEREQKESRNK